ncbi:7513_t:CDS:10, partial [Entrophospora sp. SA101]
QALKVIGKMKKDELLYHAKRLNSHLNANIKIAKSYKKSVINNNLVSYLGSISKDTTRANQALEIVLSKWSRNTNTKKISDNININNNLAALKVIGKMKKDELLYHAKRLNSHLNANIKIAKSYKKSVINNNLVSYLGSISKDTTRANQALEIVLSKWSRNTNTKKISDNININNNLAGLYSNNDLRFKSSPFYNIIERLSLPKICSVTSSNEIVLLDFVLNSNQVGKLKSSPRYKINLFCCSAEQNLQNIQNESLVEFPDSCEVRVNHKMSPYRKSRSDAQPPRDITDLCKVTSAHVNQVHFGFAATSKKYLIIVLLIKTILVEEIVDKIKNGKYIEKEAVLEKIKKQIQDSDVVATSTKTTEDQETIVIDSNGNWSECKKAYKLHDIDESDDTFNKHSPNKKRKIENNIFIVDSSDGEGEENNCGEESNVKDIQTMATEIEKAADAKSININQNLINNIIRTNSTLNNFNNTITVDCNGSVTTMDNNGQVTIDPNGNCISYNCQDIHN